MIESIEDLIAFLKHFHRNLLADPSLPPEIIPDYLPDGLAKIYRELGGLVDRDILVMDSEGKGVWIGSQTLAVANIFQPGIDIRVMEGA